jgi:hypothetical protein
VARLESAPVACGSNILGFGQETNAVHIGTASLFQKVRET